MSKPTGIIKEMGFVKNEKGQMAIFIALFFQVLFVFFAMAINMGLVIHDKINLQNSVDIAAYYGAMKQGEVLNQIAHINYQMRQNYKLFVWRYRVLSTIGNVNNPLGYVYTSRGGTPGILPDAPAWNLTNTPGPTDVAPSVCVSHSYFQETVDLDRDAASVCSLNDFTLPAVPPISAGSGFVPGSGNLAPTFQFLATSLARFCMEAGIMNFGFAARILAHFRTDGLARKNMIGILAGNLTRPDPLDLRNQPIEEGVRKTFERNLTDTNRNGIQDFQYFNSLGTGGCSQVADWLAEIQITPAMFYHDWNADESSGRCGTAILKTNRGPTAGSMPFAFNNPGLYGGHIAATQELQGHWQGEPNDPKWRSSVGFEKNPWCMVYSGVKATTAVRKPFDPTGTGVTMVARGFAKPFGGRIGPWYGKNWPKGSPNSVASNRGDMVDGLLPARMIGGSAASPNPYDDVANYSRFPGDQLGINSLRTFSAMVTNFKSAMNHNSKNDVPPMAMANYQSLNGIPQLQATGDSLARIGTSSSRGWTKQPAQRLFELASTAPDPFDALYYSVEPRYHNNYFTSNTTSGGAQFNDQERIFDFGSAKDGYSDSIQGTTSQNFSVLQQITDVVVPGNTYLPEYEHVLRNWNHLLTSWHQKGVVDYTMDPAQFGICAVDVDTGSKPELPTPGNCLQGGRTGYSVKSISHDFLISSDHALGGGASGSAGAINNPPPANF